MIQKASYAIVTLVCLVAMPIGWANPVEVEPVVAQPSSIESVVAEPVPIVPIEAAVPVEAMGVSVAYPIVLAAGAIAGVLTINSLTYGVGTLPTWIGIPSTAPFVSPAAAAASRVFVITSGVIGAWIADSIYKRFE